MSTEKYHSLSQQNTSRAKLMSRPGSRVSGGREDSKQIVGDGVGYLRNEIASSASFGFFFLDAAWAIHGLLNNRIALIEHV